MKVLQINTAVNTGSTGRIAEDIGRVLLEHGHQSVIAAGKTDRPSALEVITIGSKADQVFHALKTRLTDRHGFGSKVATKRLIDRIDKIQPSVVGLHNLHGYYLNIEILFEYLSRKDIPILWTLFDCWSFTGHCTYFDDINCMRWKDQCYQCPKTHKYPASYLMDNSKRNYQDKCRLFNLPNKLEIITHSNWLRDYVKQSYLKNYTVHTLPSGIDLKRFYPNSDRNQYENEKEKVILGVASTWDLRKGLKDFKKLARVVDADWEIVLIGLSKKQIKGLPDGIRGISRTENIEELREWYARAAVFINPTWQDNFPTTNIEALACGTPVVTYDTGGSPEAVDDETGRVVDKGDIEGLWKAIKELADKDRNALRHACRTRAETHFNKDDRYLDYLRLYEQLLQ